MLNLCVEKQKEGVKLLEEPANQWLIWAAITLFLLLQFG